MTKKTISQQFLMVSKNLVLSGWKNQIIFSFFPAVRWREPFSNFLSFFDSTITPTERDGTNKKTNPLLFRNGFHEDALVMVLAEGTGLWS